MSVLVSDRKESKLEVLVYSVEIHNMLIELMSRAFGVKDLNQFVRERYAYGYDDKEDFYKYRYIMQNAKTRIDNIAGMMTSNLRAANTIYPTSMKEYERRREFQNFAIVNCEQLIKELQQIVDVFNVDVNLYKRYINAIDREIDLIKKWRQRDNKIKLKLNG